MALAAQGPKRKCRKWRSGALDGKKSKGKDDEKGKSTGKGLEEKGKSEAGKGKSSSHDDWYDYDEGVDDEGKGKGKSKAGKGKPSSYDDWYDYDEGVAMEGGSVRYEGVSLSDRLPLDDDSWPFQYGQLRRMGELRRMGSQY